MKLSGSNRYRLYGAVLSLVWFIIAASYLVVKQINPLDLAPNEFGDFLAGMLGPLGILWIVLGFWQQGDELRSSVEALRLQSEELKNSVAQQKALVDVTKSQAEVTERQADAQIQALNEESRARRKASSPKLHLHSGGGSTSVARINSRVYLENFGADCTDVYLSTQNAGREFEHRISVLKRHDRHDFVIAHDDRTFLDFEIHIDFQRADDSSGWVKFKCARKNPRATGFEFGLLGSSEDR